MPHQINEKIRRLAEGHFDSLLVEEFITQFEFIAGSSVLIDFILQISTDEGDELEIGFFTSNLIADITLSKGQVYSYSYPILKVRNMNFIETETKWILTITGEKKFDYNIVKPQDFNNLKKYETCLKKYLSTSLKINF